MKNYNNPLRPYQLFAKTLLAFLFCLLFTGPVVFQAQAQLSGLNPVTDVKSNPLEETKNSIFSYLSKNDISNITIEANFHQLIELKNKIHKEPGKLSYTDHLGQVKSHNIDLEVRGKTRRKVCDFPPMKIKFSKSNLRKNGFSDDFKSYKLVTHCNGDFEDEQNVIKEYLAYKIFNEITDTSFRVKFFDITYKDSGGRFDSIVTYGFFIENTDEMANRLGGVNIEKFSIQPADLKGSNFVTLAMFQYMVGNTDWRIPNLHNVKIVHLPDSNQYLAVPYDFDYSGFVNAYYARPNPDLDQPTVRDRICLGNYHDEEHLQLCYQPFRLAKLDIINICDQLEFLDKKSKKYTTKYLLSFFNAVENEARAKRILESQNTQYAGKHAKKE